MHPTPTRPITKQAWEAILRAAAARAIKADHEAHEARVARNSHIKAAYGTGLFSTAELGRLTDMSKHSAWWIATGH